jgi:very-short-patch-repair endonuclease
VLPWPIDVTVPRSGPSGFDGVRIHRPRRIHPDDVAEVRGIRVTSVERTLLDLCDVLAPDAVLRHVREAEYQGLLDPVALSALLARSNGRRGIRLLRPFAAGTSDSHGTRSELERRFKRLCRDGRMPEFETQVPIVANGKRYVADFYWRGQRLVVEVDGRGGHDTVSAFENDRVRDADFALEGILPIRVTAKRIGDEPDAVLDTVRQLLVQRGWAG